jgi:hypothetical protein
MNNALNIEKPDHVYRINPTVVFESFNEGALVLRLDDRHLFELNSAACVILGQTDGLKTVNEIASKLAETDGVIIKDVLSDVTELYDQLEAQNILELVDLIQNERRTLLMEQNLAPDSIYLCNPEVVLREEDQDGGLLFNPDTNQIKVINSTGLLIWKQFNKQQGLETVVASLLDAFEGVSRDEIITDVQLFLDDMVQSGFIGTVETKNK